MRRKVTSADPVRLLDDVRGPGAERRAAGYECLPEGYYEIDGQGTLLAVNPALARILGRSEEELIGRTLASLERQAAGESIAGLIDRCRCAATPPGLVEWAFNNRDGRSCWAELSIVAADPADGSVERYHGFVREITDRKTVEAELERCHRELQQLRLRSDAQVQELVKQSELLAHAREQVADAARTKSEFVANVSHEIRTPINGIMGMTDLALTTSLDAEQREYLELIKGSAGSLLNLINEILDFSKLEAGRFKLESIPFNAQDCVRDALRPLSDAAREKGLEFELTIDAGVPRAVVGDPGRLRQVLSNVVHNAVKFTHKGKVSVSVRRSDRGSEQATLEFVVRDTGVGIEAGQLARIFAAFTQADGSATREFGGTGLGLAISSQLVGLMGGAIDVESEPGVGSRFRFDIGVRLDSSPSQRALCPHRDLHGVRLLVVGGGPGWPEELGGDLEPFGIEIDGEPSMADAVIREAEFRRNGAPHHVLVIDPQPGDDDGLAFDLAADLRKTFADEAPAVLLLAQAGSRGDATRCRRHGIHGYLTKPVAMLDLLDAVRAVLAPGDLPASGRLVTRHSLRETRRNLRVLLAEDRPTSELVTRRLLERAGHTVVSVNAGHHVLERLRHERFDVLLMDTRMSDLDGLTTTASIRHGDAGDASEIPIIALTAHATESDRERLLEGGMDACIARPCDAAALYAALEELFPARSEEPRP